MTYRRSVAPAVASAAIACYALMLNTRGIVITAVLRAKGIMKLAPTVIINDSKKESAQ